MSSVPPKLVPFPAPAPETPAQLPEDLAAQIQSIRAFATVHNLLTVGSFTIGTLPAVAESLQFLKALHGQAIITASSHERAAEVPELAQFLEAAKKAEENKDEPKEDASV